MWIKVSSTWWLFTFDSLLSWRRSPLRVLLGMWRVSNKTSRLKYVLVSKLLPSELSKSKFKFARIWKCLFKTSFSASLTCLGSCILFSFGLIIPYFTWWLYNVFKKFLEIFHSLLLVEHSRKISPDNLACYNGNRKVIWENFFFQKLYQMAVTGKNDLLRGNLDLFCSVMLASLSGEGIILL